MLRWRTRPADRVVIDHPTYPHAIDAITSALCRPVPVGLTAEGWDVEVLADRIVSSGARLAYLILDHHNPTSHFMAAADRARLFAATARSEALIVVDETLVDLWLDEPPGAGDPPPDAPHVLRLGSMSKSFWGGLRVGWVRAEAGIIAALGQARAAMDLGVAVLEQLATAELLTTGEGVVAERRRMLAARRDWMMDLMAERLPAWRIERPGGGLSLWAELPGPFSSRLTAEADRRGVRVAAGPRFGVDGAFERFLRLPYTLSEESLARVVGVLAELSAGLEGEKPGRRATKRVETSVF